MLKVLHPHLNVQKCYRHIRDRKPSQTPPKKKKIPKIVHIDEDTPKASMPTHYTIHVNLVSAEFLPIL